MKNMISILISLFLVLLAVFTSCEKEPEEEEQTVNSVWKRIILTNPTDYNLPDEIDGELTFIMSDARTYESEGWFVKTDNGNYILKDSLILPTSENLLYLFVKFDFNGWLLEAELPPYSVKEYTCKDTIEIDISCGWARISYLKVDSVSETTVDLTFKLEDLGVDSVIDILLKLKTLDDGTEVYSHTYPAECGVYTARFEGLEAGTDYEIDLYAHNISGYKYLRYCYFETLEGEVPLTAETWDVSNITRTSASLSGTILFSGDETTVVERGFIWGTIAELDYTQNIGIKICGNGVGPFFATISNLTPSVTYFTRAYAKNADSEIVYGEVISFTTLDISPPTIGTVQLYSITSSTAYCSSAVSDGGSPITDKGFVYSFSNDPSLESFFGITHNGAGGGGFARTIVDLWPNRTYYICAYAVTAVGVYYGDVTVFTTEPLIEK